MEGETKPVKPKRQLTEKQLDQLAKAREKANAVRKKNAELKRKGKQVTLMKRQQEEEALDQEIASLTGKQKPKQPKKQAKKKAPQLVAQEDLVSSSDDESESSASEPEPEPEVSKPRRKAKAKKNPKRVKQESSSDESSDEDYAPDKRQLSRQMRQDSMYDRQMERAFGSLFPNYNV